MKLQGLLAIAGALTIIACGSAPNDDTSSALTSCAKGPTIEGIDVSKWDGTIDWNAVAQSGRAFAFIRVSDGLTHYDPQFDANWANAKAAGLYRGVYQFFRPTEDATAQADLLLSHMGTLGPGDLPPVLDVEVTDGASGSHIRAGVDTWSARIQQMTGITPIVYTSPGFWAYVGGGADGDTLWIANWGPSCPSMASSWSSWTFWQYSDNGQVPGIHSRVDLNKFNGTLADLADFSSTSVGGGAPPPPPSDDGGAPPTTDAGADAGTDAGGDAGGDASTGTSCVTDGDCNPGNDGSGQICVQNTCVPGCNADWECPGITSCVNGSCQ
jgi:lysozyme